MKYILRCPTEMYAFWECEFEGSILDAWNHYRDMVEMTKPQPISNIESKEWRELIDATLTGTIVGDPGVLDSLNPLQRFAVNEIKKAKKRLAAN